MTIRDAESAGSAGDACVTGTCGRGWRLPLALALVLAAIVIARQIGERETTVSRDTTAPTSTNASASPSDQRVSLAIEFGDGRQRQFDPVPWRAGMTVDDLLTAASRLSNGIKYSLRGSGASAMLLEIDGARNEGARGRNWTYTVNGTRADRSFAVYPLQPGDHVLWTFAAAE